MVSPRPVLIDDLDHIPADDGLFGSESVTWHVMASPSTSPGAAAAVLVQMLHPRVMRLIDHASSFREGLAERGRLTAEYALTITYGDTAATERAGGSCAASTSITKRPTRSLAMSTAQARRSWCSGCTAR
jgi:uncharacterized protein (DUF2236 family)